MGAIDTAVKSEIVRLAKKEARRLTVPLREEIRRLKNKNLELKSHIDRVDDQCTKLYAKGRLDETASKAATGQVTGRLSPRLVKSLRTKLGLAQGAFAKLLGVSIGSVVNWEAGKMKPRPEMRTKILSFRGMGRREVKLIVSNIFPGKSRPMGAAASQGAPGRKIGRRRSKKIRQAVKKNRARKSAPSRPMRRRGKGKRGK